MKSAAKIKIKWTRVIYITGIIALLIGVLDPLEGSLVIVFGSTTYSTRCSFNTDNHRRKAYLLAFLLIAAGVSFMFYFSSLGGFGGESNLSWWWPRSNFLIPSGGFWQST
ncbi:MAG: hypothetical protein U5K51_10515 [Flavobacteriaceae bacterium]|nr:hypothetical protein [Flavobacteriaceae bacterium]